MKKYVKAFVNELDLNPADPSIYDEMAMRFLFEEVLESVKSSSMEKEASLSYISAVESATYRLSTELDEVSFGLGYAQAISALLDASLREVADRAAGDRRFRCFKTNVAVLEAIIEHPHHTHTELAKAINKSKGRLSQIMVELKANHLVLVDRIGKENRYKLTGVAKKLLREESSNDNRRTLSNLMTNAADFGTSDISMKVDSRSNALGCDRDFKVEEARDIVPEAHDRQRNAISRVA